MLHLKRLIPNTTFKSKLYLRHQSTKPSSPRQQQENTHENKLYSDETGELLEDYQPRPTSSSEKFTKKTAADLINIKTYDSPVYSSKTRETHKSDRYDGTKVAQVSVAHKVGATFRGKTSLRDQNGRVRRSAPMAQKLMRLDENNQEVKMETDGSSLQNYMLEASTGNIQKSIRHIPEDIMEAAKNQVYLESQVKAKNQLRKIASGKRAKGMIVNIDDLDGESERGADRLETLTAYDAVMSVLKNKKDEEDVVLANINHNTPNFIRNYYKHSARRYTHSLSMNELIVKLHQEMIYADSGFMVFNKPYGLFSKWDKNSRSLEEYSPSVKRIIYGDDKSISGGHFFSLPKNVTGCTVIAKSRGELNDGIVMLQNRNLIQQVFIAICQGKPVQGEGVIDIPVGEANVQCFSMEKMMYRSVLKPVREDIKADDTDGNKISKNNKQYFGRRAVTYFKLLGYNAETNTSILQVEPLTTTPDQINIHLADALGCPILGDHKYSSDFNLRGGIGNLNFIKNWFKLSKSQPLNEKLYKALGFGAVSQTSYLPLHLHLARVYIPGMAGNRNELDSKVKSDLLLPDTKTTELKHNNRDFLMNSGSTLLCQASLPKFWRETLNRCGLLKEIDIFGRMKQPQVPRLFGIEKVDELEINLTNVNHPVLKSRLKVKVYENHKKVVKVDGLKNRMGI